MAYGIETVIRHMIAQNNQNINISFPAVVVGVESLKDGFVDVQPIVNYINTSSSESMPYPVINDVSLVFPNTQATSICFPVKQGDFVSLLFQTSDIQDFISGNAEVHEPAFPTYGNLANVVAIVGFTPYQQSCFNPMNYNNDFDNQDLNIVHNKNTDNEAIISINPDGDISLKSPTTVTIESKEVQVVADTIKANNAVISTDGDLTIQGKSVHQFMLSHTHIGNQGAPTSHPQGI